MMHGSVYYSAIKNNLLHNAYKCRKEAREMGSALKSIAESGSQHSHRVAHNCM